MIKEITSAPDNVVAFEYLGKITREDYDILNPMLERHKNRFGKILLYVEMIDTEWPTITAMWEDLKTDIRFFTDVEKVAFVTDKKWLEKATEFSAFFAPMEYKSFEAGSRQEAFNWLQLPKQKQVSIPQFPARLPHCHCGE